MKIAIVEDHVEYLNLINEKLIDSFENIETCVFEDGESFLANNVRYDIVLLDIELPGIDGIEVSKKIIYKDTYIVFLTSTPDRVFEAFGENVLGYLLKADELNTNIKKINEFIDHIKKRKYLHIKSELGDTDILLDDIIKVCKENRRIYFYTNNAKIHVYDNTLIKLYDISDGYLIYANKSSLINIKKIVSFSNTCIELEGNLQESISRRYLSVFKKEYLKRVSK